VKKYVPLAFALVGLVILLSLNIGESGLSTTSGETGDTLTQGDVDCDGDVNSVDALLLLRVSSQQSTDEGCDAGTDNDCNGALDAIDALRVLRHSAGLSVDYRRGCPLIGGNQTPAPSPGG